MAFLVKQVFFKNFPDRNSKNDDVMKNMPPFWIFLWNKNYYVFCARCGAKNREVKQNPLYTVPAADTTH